MKKKIRLLTFVICIWMIIGFNIEAMAANNALAIQEQSRKLGLSS